MVQFLDLPAEVLLRILANLPSPDLCSVALAHSTLRYLVQEDWIWIRKAKAELKINLKKTEYFSPRQFYQKVLFRFGPLLGLWQRTDLRYYSGLINISFSNNAVIFEHLKAPKSIFDEVRKVKMFEIKDTDSKDLVAVEKGDIYRLVPGNVKIMFENKTLLEEDNNDKAMIDGIKQIIYNFFTVDPHLVGETDGILRIYNDSSDYEPMEELFEKYVLEEMGLDTNKRTEFLSQLQTEKCRETFYSSSCAWYKKLDTLDASTSTMVLDASTSTRVLDSCSQSGSVVLPQGVFKGDYGPHGVELIQVIPPSTGVRGLRGVKVTGDPNVPFGKITFEVEDDRCLNIPTRSQKSCNSILQFHQDPQYIDYQDGLRLPFQCPGYCHGTESLPVTTTHCMGRWMCRCQIAGVGFINEEMIPGNFIVFNENLFAVLFLELNSFSLYSKVTEL